MCGRLRVGKCFFTFCSIVGAAMCSAFNAVHMTAGHNALRGSGPGHKPAFDNALARVGCPDRRIDRLCITCCSPSQPHITPVGPTRSRFTAQARWVLVALALGHYAQAIRAILLASAMGQPWSAFAQQRREPCVDGSGLASAFSRFAALVGAAMCSAFHAVHMTAGIMPSADQVPVINPHSTMRWHEWVVLIAGSTGSALRAVRPPNLTSRRLSTRSRLPRKRDGFLVALALGHYGPGHSRNLVGKRDGGNLGRLFAPTTP